MQLYFTIEEYEQAIKETQQAIQRVILIGQENENDSGGSSRKMKDADLEQLRKHLVFLIKGYKSLGGNNVVFTEIGW